MLQAGGMALLADEARPADELNPHGYFELTQAKDLGKSTDLSWLAGARGKAVKLVSSLLEHLPRQHNYRIIFMLRDLHEVIASQDTMLATRNEPRSNVTEADLLEIYESHLRRVRSLIARRRCFEPLYVGYSGVLSNPLNEAGRLVTFLKRPLDAARMASAVDHSLYRHRR
jgi:hypothetical protein